MLDAHIVFSMEIEEFLLGIPEDGVLSLKMPRGQLHGTCNNQVLISAIFSNISGNGIIVFTGDSNPGIYINVTQVDSSQVNFQLEEPNLPLPPDLVHGIFIHFLENTYTILNQFFYNHPQYLPDDIKPYVPNPQISLVHMDGCADGLCGWLDIRSYCNAGNNVGLPWAACMWSPTAVSARYDYSQLGIYFLDFSEEACTLDNVGSFVNSIFLPDSLGECVPVPNMEDEYFYQLYMNSQNQISKFHLCMSSNCSEGCIAQSTQFGVCDGSSMILSQQSPCIGPAVLTTEPVTTAYLVTYDTSLSCDLTVDTTLQKLGSINNCYSNGESFSMVSISGAGTYNLHLECTDVACTQNCTFYPNVLRSECYQVYYSFINIVLHF